MSEIYSEEAEQACSLMMHELSKFRAIEAALDGEPAGRLSSPQKGEISAGYSAVTAMVAIVEQFAVHALQLRFEDVFSASTAISEGARTALLKQIEQSWPQRTKALQRWFEGSLTPGPITDVLAFVEARNAIAHGLGRLTRRQLSDDSGRKVKEKLRDVGIVESAGRIAVPELAVARLAFSGRSVMIEWDVIARTGELKSSLA